MNIVTHIHNKILFFCGMCVCSRALEHMYWIVCFDGELRFFTKMTNLLPFLVMIIFSLLLRSPIFFFAIFLVYIFLIIDSESPSRKLTRFAYLFFLLVNPPSTKRIPAIRRENIIRKISNAHFIIF